MSDKGGPDIDEIADVTQFGFTLQNKSWLLGYAAGRLSVIGPWKERKDNVLAEFDKLADMLLVANGMLMRVRALMEDPDPYRQDLGPDGTFNVPCVLVSDLKEALDG